MPGRDRTSERHVFVEILLRLEAATSGRLPRPAEELDAVVA